MTTLTNVATYEQLCEVLKQEATITTFKQLSNAMYVRGYTGAIPADIEMAFGYINQFRETKHVLFAQNWRD